MEPRIAGTPTVGDRLHKASVVSFVGRQHERNLFQQAIGARGLPFHLLTILGPGGIGKTALLDQFQIIAHERGITCGNIDVRHIPPAPAAFEEAAYQSLGFHPSRPGDSQRRFVLLLDTFDALAPLNEWFYEQFVPSIPDAALLVLASRNALPSPSALSAITRTISLRNLEEAESFQLLERRNIAPAERDQLVAVSHGHPLALSIAADTLTQAGRIGPLERVNIVRTLLDRLVESTPTARHRTALEIAAHARVTTEALLTDAIDPETAPELFRWLASLSFIECGPDGLFPHDLARDIIHGDLAWRNAASLQDINRRVRKHYLRRFEDGVPGERFRALQDLVYLHRVNPIMRTFFKFSSIGHVWIEPATSQDLSAILKLVERFEGRQSASIARHWMGRQPGSFVALRSASNPFAGGSCQLDLREVTQGDAVIDPVLAEAMRVIESDPPRPGEPATLHRFMVSAESYQSPSPATTAIQVRSYVNWMTTPRLSWSLLVVDGETPWDDLMRYIDFAPVGKHIDAIPPRGYRLFAHDWRRVDPVAWFDAMEEREIDTTLTAAQVAPMEERLVVLAEGQFRKSVHDALRHLSNDVELASNPLLRSRMLIHSQDDPKPGDLRKVLSAAIEDLRAKPREVKFFRALELTYLRPAPSQEMAAERLGVPFGTYRYQLARGIERVGDRLWSLECGHDGDDAAID